MSDFNLNQQNIFNLDAHLSNIKDNASGKDIVLVLGAEKYNMITERVVNVLTNPKGTREEKEKHNEILARCAKGDVMAQRQVKSLIAKVLTEERLVDAGILMSVTEQIYKDNYGLGVIEDLYNNKEISEIWVNGCDSI